jgi:hypothetical protein
VNGVEFGVVVKLRENLPGKLREAEKNLCIFRWVMRRETKTKEKVFISIIFMFRVKKMRNNKEI